MKLGCKKCGGNVVFLPSSGKCHCDHCGSNISPEEFSIKSIDVTYNECTCSSCGAKLVVEDSTIITVCAYCGSRELVTSHYAPLVQVDEIIPFQIDHDEFQKKADAFLTSQLLAPEYFRYCAPLEEVKGVYLLVKNIQTRANVLSRGLTIDNTPFDFHYEVDSHYFVDNSFKMKDAIMDQLLQNHGDDVKIFNPYFLTDFSVDIGDMSEKKIVNTVITAEEYYVEETYPFVYRDHTSGTPQKTGVTLANTSCESIKNVLIPVWIFSVNYRKKKYTYLMDGQNGNIYAYKENLYRKRGFKVKNKLFKTPLSNLKMMIILVLAILIGIFLLSTLFLSLANSFIFNLIVLFAIVVFCYSIFPTNQEKKLQIEYKDILKKPFETETKQIVYHKYDTQKEFSEEFGTRHLMGYQADFHCSQEKMKEYEKSRQ